MEESLNIRLKISTDQMLISNTHLARGDAFKEQEGREADALEAYKNCLRVRLRYYPGNAKKIKQAKEALCSFQRSGSDDGP